MVEGWLDAVTDSTIWGRVTGEDEDGPVSLRIEVDGRLWGFARAAHVDPGGGPWRFAVAHHLADGQAVGVFAVLPGQDPLPLEGSPRRVPASAPPRGRLEAVTATEVVGWAVDDDCGGHRDPVRPLDRGPGPGPRRTPGAGDDSAINLDGGGSTTMVLDGTVVNRVSDPQERRVSMAVLVLAGPAPAVPPPAALAPEVDQAAQRADLEAIAADPGSSAGLLGWLSDPG